MTWGRNDRLPNDAVGQEQQKDFIIQKANIFLFKVQLRCLRYSKMFLYHVTILCKGLIPKYNSRNSRSRRHFEF